MTTDVCQFEVVESHLSDAASKVKHIIGDELWDKMQKEVGGETIYIPVVLGYYERRNRAIMDFAINHTVRETAKHFLLSLSSVQKILRKKS
jgi:Mor family transcriptional regulator